MPSRSRASGVPSRSRKRRAKLWKFKGRVTDRETERPAIGVEADTIVVLATGALCVEVRVQGSVQHEHRAGRGGKARRCGREEGVIGTGFGDAGFGAIEPEDTIGQYAEISGSR